MIGRGPGGSAAHLLCSRSAAAARPPWDRVGGSAVRGAAGRSPRRRPGTGAGERREVQGPQPRPLCPCAPPPGSAVERGGRWPVAEAAPGPLGTALSIDSNRPLPSTVGRWVKKWVRGQRRTNGGEMWVTTSYSVYVCGKGR